MQSSVDLVENHSSPEVAENDSDQQQPKVDETNEVKLLTSLTTEGVKNYASFVPRVLF